MPFVLLSWMAIGKLMTFFFFWQELFILIVHMTSAIPVQIAMSIDTPASENGIFSRIGWGRSNFQFKRNTIDCSLLDIILYILMLAFHDILVRRLCYFLVTLCGYFCIVIR